VLPTNSYETFEPESGWRDFIKVRGSSRGRLRPLGGFLASCILGIVALSVAKASYPSEQELVRIVRLATHFASENYVALRGRLISDNRDNVIYSVRGISKIKTGQRCGLYYHRSDSQLICQASYGANLEHAHQASRAVQEGLRNSYRRLSHCSRGGAGGLSCTEWRSSKKGDPIVQFIIMQGDGGGYASFLTVTHLL
jgi:hypothetical protein